LGPEIVCQLVKLPETSVVFAATRSNPSTALQQLIDEFKGKVVYILSTVTDKASLKAVASQVEAKLGGKGLDVLINIEGILS